MTRKLWFHHGSYYLRHRVTVAGREAVRYRNLGRDRFAAIDRMRMLEDVPDLAAHPDVDEFARSWRHEYVQGRRNVQGQALAKQRLRDHILPELGRKLVGEVRSPDLRRLRVRLDGSGLAPQSVRHVLSDVRCLFAYAVESGIIPRSPWVRGLLPKIQRRPPRALAETEVARVFQSCPSFHRPILRFAVLTGMRYGELRALRWADVDFEDCVVMVTRSHTNDVTKTRTARVVPLLAAASAVLAGLPRSSDLVFPSREGGMRGKNAQNFLKPITRAVPGFTMHRLRHTCARDMEIDGVPRHVAARLLGQSEVVNADYAQPNLADLQRVAARRDTTTDTTRTDRIREA